MLMVCSNYSKCQFLKAIKFKLLLRLKLLNKFNKLPIKRLPKTKFQHSPMLLTIQFNHSTASLKTPTKKNQRLFTNT